MLLLDELLLLCASKLHELAAKSGKMLLYTVGTGTVFVHPLKRSIVLGSLIAIVYTSQVNEDR